MIGRDVMAQHRRRLAGSGAGRPAMYSVLLAVPLSGAPPSTVDACDAGHAREGVEQRVDEGRAPSLAGFALRTESPRT